MGLDIGIAFWEPVSKVGGWSESAGRRGTDPVLEWAIRNAGSATEPCLAEF